jgi:anti-sigma-K factor RskA
MTGQIIPLHGDEHRDAQLLLPWYVTGRLDAQDRAKIEAHLVGCADCQSDLAFERRLEAAVADLPVEAESGWEQLRGRLPNVRRRPPARETAAAFGAGWGRLFGDLSGWRLGGGTLGWAVAAQFVMLLLLGSVLVMRLPGQPARYQALGAAPAPAAAIGNLVIIFRPDTPERDLRAILTSNSLRLVDGPTAADAYVLRVAPARRAAVLATLRARREVVLAEPIDANGRP